MTTFPHTPGPDPLGGGDGIGAVEVEVEPRPAIRDLARSALALLARGGRFLGLTGPPGSGKSTLSVRLARELDIEVAVLSADGFHLANRVLVELGLLNVKGSPETFDVPGFHSLLRRVASGTEPIVYAPMFVRQIEEAVAGAVSISSEAALVIVEGNYLCLDDCHWKGTSAFLDEIWYLDVDAGIRRSRLIARRLAQGFTEAEAATWADGSDLENARLIEATQGRAQRIVRLR